MAKEDVKNLVMDLMDGKYKNAKENLDKAVKDKIDDRRQKKEIEQGLRNPEEQKT